MFRKYVDSKVEFLFIVLHDSLGQLLATIIAVYSLVFIFWGDNIFRIVLLYMELVIGFTSLFIGMLISLYAVHLLLFYYGRLNGQKNEVVFKGCMCFVGCLISCFFIGLIWDWLASVYYTVIAAPVDMKWFLWEFFAMHTVLLTQIDNFSDLYQIDLKTEPDFDVPAIGQLALAEGLLNELQIKHIERQQYFWKRRAFKRLMSQSNKYK